MHTSTKTFWFSFVVLFIVVFSVKAQQQFEPGMLYVKTTNSYELALGIDKPPFFDGIISADEFGITAINPAFRLLNDPVLNKIFKIMINKEEKISRLVEELNKLPYIEYAEPIPIYNTFLTPNDLNSSQWYLNKINAELAWGVTTGSNDVVLAIVDDAVLLTHEDLAPNIWTNPGEIPNNGIDDDHNGFIDDVHGWDVADNDNDVSPPAATVSNSNFTHGTHCAGIAAAATDNNKGVASISYNVQILPVKTKLSATSGPSLQATFEGIEYAIFMKADIISMSFGSYFNSLAIQSLIDRGHWQGVTFFAAAGNNSTDIHAYPASYDHVISVGATDANDRLAWFSNYGSAIDLMAPGVDIFSTLAGNNSAYGNESGTSMACPLAAGLGALVLSHNPNYGPDDLELLLKQTATKIDGLNSAYAGQLGAGRIDAFAAAKQIKPIWARFKSDATFVCGNRGDTLHFTDLSSPNPSSWLWSFPGGNPSSSTQQNPDIVYNNSGDYNVVLIATNAYGSDSLVKTNYITVGIPSSMLSGNQTIYSGLTAYLKIEFVGNPPFSITYFDGTNNISVNNIDYSPYFLKVTPTQTKTYSLVSYADRDCAGTVSGTAVVTVDPNAAPCGFVQDFKVVSALATGILSLDDLQAIGDIDGNGVTEIAWGDAWDVDGALNTGAVYIFFIDSNETVIDTLKISASTADLANSLNGGDEFGFGTGRVGDLDGDGIDEIAVGAPGDDDARPAAGAIYILFLDSTGIVRHHKKILAPEPTTTTLAFGQRVIGMGDIDKDGVPDLVASTTPVFNINSVIGIDELYVLFLNHDGTLKSYVEYDSTAWYLQNQNIISQAFGLTNVGDIDGNGINDFMADSEPIDTVNIPPNINRIYFLDSTGTIIDTASIVAFNDPGISPHWFGRYVSGIGDVDLDGIPDLVIPDIFGWHGIPPVAAIFITFLNRDGTVKSYQKITNGSGGLPNGTFPQNANFGFFPRPLGDIDGDGGLNICVPGGDPTFGNIFYMLDLANCAPHTCLAKASFIGATGCLNYPVMFSDSSSINGPYQIDRWDWDFGDGSVSNLQNPEHTFSNTGSYNVRLMVTDAQNLCSDSITKQVVISDNFALNGSNSLQICVGDSIELPLQVICGLEPIVYNWASLSGSERNPEVSPSATTAYSVTVTNGNGTTATKSITVVVDHSCCTSHAGIVQTRPEDCYSGNIQFTNHSTAQPGASYEWLFGSSAMPAAFSGASPPPISFAGNGFFEVKLVVNDACGTDTAAHQFLILEKPDLMMHDTAVCNIDSLQIGTQPIADYYYSWSPASGVSDPQAANPYVYGSGMYIITATDGWTDCAITDTVNVGIGKVDSTAHFTYNANGLTVTFNDTLTQPHGRSWQFGDNSGFSSLQNPVYTYAAPGSYQVCLTISGCGSVKTCEVIEVFETGINEINQPSLELFPNPATNQITLLLHNFSPSPDMAIDIFNTLGQKMNFRYDCQRDAYILDLKGISKGLYHIRITSGNVMVTRRFVKN